MNYTNQILLGPFLPSSLSEVWFFVLHDKWVLITIGIIPLLSKMVQVLLSSHLGVYGEATGSGLQLELCQMTLSLPPPS